MSFLRDFSSFWMPKTFVGLFWHISLAGSHPSPTQGVFKSLQGSLSPFRGETPSDRGFALQVDTPLTLFPWMHLCIGPVRFPPYRPLHCSCKPCPLLSPLKVLLHLLPVPPPQPMLLTLPWGFELFNPPYPDLLPSASPLLSTLSHLL